MPVQCDIVTQEKSVFSGEVASVSLPGSEGRMGILPNHSPLLTTLAHGEVIIHFDGEKDSYYAVGGGFAEIQPDKIIILADSAEAADKINIERAKKARERAEKFMAEGVQEDTDQYVQIRASLMRAQVRLDVAHRRQHHSALPTGRGSEMDV